MPFRCWRSGKASFLALKQLFFFIITIIILMPFLYVITIIIFMLIPGKQLISCNVRSLYIDSLSVFFDSLRIIDGFFIGNLKN